MLHNYSSISLKEIVFVIFSLKDYNLVESVPG